MLEGDGLLATKAYDLYQEAKLHCSNFTVHPLLSRAAQEALPRAQAVPREGAPITVDDLVNHGRQCVQPVFDYFNSRFGGSVRANLKSTVRFFKAARMWNPGRFHLYSANEVEEELKSLPFISVENRAALLQERGRYLVRAEGQPATFDSDHELWWRQQRLELPAWFDALAKICVFQPSSACAERVFSLVNAALNDQQERALEDLVSGSIMLRYNNKQRERMA